MQSTSETSVISLALMAKWILIPELHGTVTIKKTVLAAHHLQGTTDSRLKHNPSLSVIKTYLLSLKLTFSERPQERPRGTTTQLRSGVAAWRS